jgi:hypothetical protein
MNIPPTGVKFNPLQQQQSKPTQVPSNGNQNPSLADSYSLAAQKALNPKKK